MTSYIIECKLNTSRLYLRKKKLGNCSNRGIKYKLSALLYISRNKIVWIYVEALDSDVQICWYIFLIWVSDFVDIYTFFKKTAVILYFCHFL